MTEGIVLANTLTTDPEHSLVFVWSYRADAASERVDIDSKTRREWRSKVHAQRLIAERRMPKHCLAESANERVVECLRDLHLECLSGVARPWPFVATQITSFDRRLARVVLTSASSRKGNQVAPSFSHTMTWPGRDLHH